MRSFLPDTSCMIAAVCGWHEFHERASREISMRLKRLERMIVAAPALIEAYAVLTRLPAPHRLSPDDALTLLKENFLTRTKLIALNPSDYRKVVLNAAGSGVAGGRTYDAVIAACAMKARTAVILTFNESDFSLLIDHGTEIIVP